MKRKNGNSWDFILLFLYNTESSTWKQSCKVQDEMEFDRKFEETTSSLFDTPTETKV